jgi:hypothetical protein
VSKKTYTVASEAGALHFGEELGTALELDLEPDRELAYVAAGWLEPEKKKGKEG